MIGESSVLNDHSANLGGAPAPNSLQILAPVNLQSDDGHIRFREVLLCMIKHIIIRYNGFRSDIRWTGSDMLIMIDWS